MKIYQMTTEQDKAKFKMLSIEYLQWLLDQLKINFDAEFEGELVDYVEEEMKNLGKLMPPRGCLLLCDVDGEITGMAGMRELAADICEIKRVYVRPEFRGRGIARTLFARLLDTATEKQYPRMRLDSGRFMTSAHKLYQANGFKEIERYEGSEVPSEWTKYWMFFERSL